MAPVLLSAVISVSEFHFSYATLFARSARITGCTALSALAGGCACKAQADCAGTAAADRCWPLRGARPWVPAVVVMAATGASSGAAVSATPSTYGDDRSLEPSSHEALRRRAQAAGILNPSLPAAASLALALVGATVSTKSPQHRLLADVWAMLFLLTVLATPIVSVFSLVGTMVSEGVVALGEAVFVGAVNFVLTYLVWAMWRSSRASDPHTASRVRKLRSKNKDAHPTYAPHLEHLLSRGMRAAEPADALVLPRQLLVAAQARRVPFGSAGFSGDGSADVPLMARLPMANAVGPGDEEHGVVEPDHAAGLSDGPPVGDDFNAPEARRDFVNLAYSRHVSALKGELWDSKWVAGCLVISLALSVASAVEADALASNSPGAGFVGAMLLAVLSVAPVLVATFCVRALLRRLAGRARTVAALVPSLTLSELEACFNEALDARDACARQTNLIVGGTFVYGASHVVLQAVALTASDKVDRMYQKLLTSQEPLLLAHVCAIAAMCAWASALMLSAVAQVSRAYSRMALAMMRQPAAAERRRPTFGQFLTFVSAMHVSGRTTYTVFGVPVSYGSLARYGIALGSVAFTVSSFVGRVGA